MSRWGLFGLLAALAGQTSADTWNHWGNAMMPTADKAVVAQFEGDDRATAGTAKLLDLSIGERRYRRVNGFLIAESFVALANQLSYATLTYHGFVPLDSRSRLLRASLRSSNPQWPTRPFELYSHVRTMAGAEVEIAQQCKASRTLSADFFIPHLPGQLWEISCHTLRHPLPAGGYTAGTVIYYYSGHLAIPVKVIDPAGLAGFPKGDITLRFKDADNAVRLETIKDNGQPFAFGNNRKD